MQTISHSIVIIYALFLGEIMHDSNSIPSSFTQPPLFLNILRLLRNHADTHINTHIYRYYAAALPSILNVFSLQCFLILNSIIGGQALAAVSDKLNDTLGVVIIGLISFVVGFF